MSTDRSAIFTQRLALRRTQFTALIVVGLNLLWPLVPVDHPLGRNDLIPWTALTTAPRG